MSDDLDHLIAAADLAGLVRLADDWSDARDWSGLLRLRDRSRAALDTGRQLWPAATRAEYLLALGAPPEWAAKVLTEDAGRFSPGPLTEVAASTHTFAELAPHLPDGPSSPMAAVLAHERVLRGEAIPLDAVRADVVDLPLAVLAWEPSYPLAVYLVDQVDFPLPPLPQPTPTSLPAGFEPSSDTEVEWAVRELVSPWTAESNGRCEVAAVEGDHLDAIAALGVSRARTVTLDPATALSWLGWAGASGGAHGRRRGAASGRLNAWWTLAALGGLSDDWPVDPDELGALAGSLEWHRWDAHEPPTGWHLQLAVHDPVDGLAWAWTAVDHV